MRITEISKDLLVDGKVRIKYDRPKFANLIYSKDGRLLPTNGKAMATFANDCIYEYDLNKVYYEDRVGYETGFTAFIQENDGFFDRLYMLEMNKNELQNDCTMSGIFSLAEKDYLMKDLKQPSTVILREDFGRIMYENFPNMKRAKDYFNKRTEDERIAEEQEKHNIFKAVFCGDKTEEKIDTNNLSIDIFDSGMFKSHNYAVTFLSDEIVKYTKIEATMKGVDKYQIALTERYVDFSNILNRSGEEKKAEVELPVL